MAAEGAEPRIVLLNQGLDLDKANLAKAPGSLEYCENFELSIKEGLVPSKGFYPFDGRLPWPTVENYYIAGSGSGQPVGAKWGMRITWNTGEGVFLAAINNYTGGLTFSWGLFFTVTQGLVPINNAAFTIDPDGLAIAGTFRDEPSLTSVIGHIAEAEVNDTLAVRHQVVAAYSPARMPGQDKCYGAFWFGDSAYVIRDYFTLRVETNYLVLTNQYQVSAPGDIVRVTINGHEFRGRLMYVEFLGGARNWGDAGHKVFHIDVFQSYWPTAATWWENNFSEPGGSVVTNLWGDGMGETEECARTVAQTINFRNPPNRAKYAGLYKTKPTGGWEVVEPMLRLPFVGGSNLIVGTDFPKSPLFELVSSDYWPLSYIDLDYTPTGSFWTDLANVKTDDDTFAFRTNEGGFSCIVSADPKVPDDSIIEGLEVTVRSKPVDTGFEHWHDKQIQMFFDDGAGGSFEGANRATDQEHQDTEIRTVVYGSKKDRWDVAGGQLTSPAQPGAMNANMNTSASQFKLTVYWDRDPPVGPTDEYRVYHIRIRLYYRHPTGSLYDVQSRGTNLPGAVMQLVSSSIEAGNLDSGNASGFLYARLKSVRMRGGQLETFVYDDNTANQRIWSYEAPAAPTTDGIFLSTEDTTPTTVNLNRNLFMSSGARNSILYTNGETILGGFDDRLLDSLNEPYIRRDPVARLPNLFGKDDAEVHTMGWAFLPGARTYEEKGSRLVSVTGNFYSLDDSTMLFGATGGSPAFAVIRDRDNGKSLWVPIGSPDTTFDDEETKNIPRHVELFQGQLALAYEAGQVALSSRGDPVSFRPALSGGIFGTGDKVKGLYATSGKALIIPCQDSIQILGLNVVGPTAGYELSTLSQNSGVIEYAGISYRGQTYYLDGYGIRNSFSQDQYGSFEEATLSTAITPWLSERLGFEVGDILGLTENPLAGAVNQAENPIAGAIFIRRKNQYRIYFRDGWVLTGTLAAPNEPPRFTTQRLALNGQVVFPASITTTTTETSGRDIAVMTLSPLPGINPQASGLEIEYLYGVDRGNAYYDTRITHIARVNPLYFRDALVQGTQGLLCQLHLEWTKEGPLWVSESSDAQDQRDRFLRLHVQANGKRGWPQVSASTEAGSTFATVPYVTVNFNTDAPFAEIIRPYQFVIDKELNLTGNQVQFQWSYSTDADNGGLTGPLPILYAIGLLDVPFRDER